MVNRSASKNSPHTPKVPEDDKKTSTSTATSTSEKKMKQTRLSFAMKDNVAAKSPSDGLRKRKLSSPETDTDRTVKIVRIEDDPEEPVLIEDDDPVVNADQEMVEIIPCDDSNSSVMPSTSSEVAAASESENTNDAREVVDENPLNGSLNTDDNSSGCSASGEDADKTSALDTSLTGANFLEPPSNPNGKPLTPRQLEKFLEKKKRHEERLRQKVERDKKLEDEKRQREERERLKKKEREEREESKRKEREEKEAARLREKEEKESAKQREKEEKETARLKEKEERDRKRQLELEQKNEEKRRKEELREEERKKKEEEKRTKELEEELKRKKAAQAFTKFFKVGAKQTGDEEKAKEVAGSAALGGQQQSSGDAATTTEVVVNRYFMPFEVKGDMKLAPTVRRVFDSAAKGALDKVLQGETVAQESYLQSLKAKSHVPLRGAKTWVSSDSSDEDSDDELMVVDDEVAHKVEEIKPKEKYRAKCLMFRENRRPAYYGTWQKKSNIVTPRRPFAKDEKLFDYEVDSDDEWEEEEPGESLHGSDDEKDKESEDDYEVDNDFFVPHGFLSDEEMQNADEPEDNSPEAQKVKLKLLQDEFNDEMKKKTEKIKPRLIGCIWADEKGGKPVNCPAVFWELLQFRAVLSAGPIELRPPPSATELDQGNEDADAEDNDTEKAGRKKAQSLPEDEIRDLIRLVHGNLNSVKFLVKEFQAYREKREANSDSLRAVSNLSILRKIKEIAKWETPATYNPCWVVQKDVLDSYELSDLELANKWEYSLVPKRTHENVKATAEKKQAAPPASPQVAVTPAVVVEVPKTPTMVVQEKSSPLSVKQKSSQNSIARFTKVLTTEEKQKQFQLAKIAASPKQSPIATTASAIPNENKAPAKVIPAKLNTEVICKPLSATKSSSVNVTVQQSTTAPAAATTTAPPAKKRVPLLMSVPRGQAISEQSKNMLIKNFLKQKPEDQDLKKAPPPSTTSVAGETISKEPVVVPTIVLD